MLAIGAVVLAFAAALLALLAQTLGVIRGLNRENLAEVEDWYLTGSRTAPTPALGTYLLVGAAALAGAAAVVTLVGGTDPPTLAVTRTSVPTPGKLTVDVTFRGLDDGENVYGGRSGRRGGRRGGGRRARAGRDGVPDAGSGAGPGHRGGDGGGARGGETCTATLTPGTAAQQRRPGG